MSDAPTFETETINATDAARFLHISKDTLYDLARSGEIPGCKVGRSWVFMKSLLMEYLRSRSTNNQARPTSARDSNSLVETLTKQRLQWIRIRDRR
jgi:excisionase family DNA binding protein